MKRKRAVHSRLVLLHTSAVLKIVVLLHLVPSCVTQAPPTLPPPSTPLSSTPADALPPGPAPIPAPECTPAIVGFTYFPSKDHNGGDLSCARDVGSWSIRGQADACLAAEGSCAGFNVDALGSCLKGVVLPLGGMWALGGEALNPCYGIYLKSGNTTFPSPPLTPPSPPPQAAPVCNHVPPGFVFSAQVDHSGDDMYCSRDNLWTLPGQAIACLGFKACQGFNFDSMGSCLKTSAAPLGVMYVLSGTVPDPCYGFYAKAPPPPPPLPTPSPVLPVNAPPSIIPGSSPTPPSPPSPPRLPPSLPVILSPPPPSVSPPAPPLPSPPPSGGTVAGTAAGIADGGSSSASAKDSSASSLPGWAIGVVAGGVVGLFALCGAAAAIVVVRRRRRQWSVRVECMPPSSASSSLQVASASASSAAALRNSSNQGADVQVHLVTQSPSWKERQSDRASKAAATGAVLQQPHSRSSSDFLLQGTDSAELRGEGPLAPAKTAAEDVSGGGGVKSLPPPLPPCLAAQRLAPLVAPPVPPRANDQIRTEAEILKPSKGPAHNVIQTDSFDVPEGSSLLIDQLHRQVADGGLHQDLHPELMDAELRRRNVKLKDEHVELFEQLGRGGSGTVYRALWKGLPVAAKLMILHADSQEKAYRQMMEATVSTGLSHPNIVNTYACDFKCLGEAEAQRSSLQQRKPDLLAKTWQITILQELCTGGSLKLLISSGALSLRVGSPEQLHVKLGHVLQLAADVASGLEHLHSKNIVHSDLTPANVLLQVAPLGSPSRPPGLQWLAKVADFGLSVIFEEGRSHVSRMFAGTPHYIAPETQAHGNISKQSDIFTLGVLMYEMACGMASSGHLSAVTPLGGSVGSGTNRRSLSSLSASRSSRSTVHSSSMTVSVQLSMPLHLPQTPVSKYTAADATPDAIAATTGAGQTDTRASPPPPPPPQQQQHGNSPTVASAAHTTLKLTSQGSQELPPSTGSNAEMQEPLLFGGCRGRNGPPMALAPLPPAVPLELRALIVQCLSQKRQHRPTVMQVHQQLNKLLQAHADAPTPASLPPRPTRAHAAAPPPPPSAT